MVDDDVRMKLAVQVAGKTFGGVVLNPHSYADVEACLRTFAEYLEALADEGEKLRSVAASEANATMTDEQREYVRRLAAGIRSGGGDRG